MYRVEKYINLSDFLEIRHQLGWKEIKIEQIEKAINNSMVNISIFDENLCVGVGRVVGDNVLKGMLTDIMVKKEYHGKGIGKLIVTNLIKEITNSLEEGELFQLEASPTSGNRDFYINCGLKYKPENQDGVYLWIKK